MIAVGTPATFHIGSDSYPYKVVAVSASGHRVTLVRDPPLKGQMYLEMVAYRGGDGKYRPRSGTRRVGLVTFGEAILSLDRSF